MNINQHGGKAAFFAKLLNRPANEILDYSANINPLGYPAEIKTAIMNNFDSLLHYPDPDYQELKQAISSYEKVEMNHLVLGNGAVELIYLLCHVFLPKKVLLPAPTFSEYELAARSIGAKIEYVFLNEENSFRLPFDKIVVNLSNYQIFFLCNPNNPTGNLLFKDEVEYLADKCKENKVVLVVDESFLEFTTFGKENSVSDLATRNEYLFTISSLTKILGIPGLRIGYGIGNLKIIKDLLKSKDPWNINCFAEIAGKVGLTDRLFLEKTRQLVQQEKIFLFNKLSEISAVQPYTSSANYLLVKILTPRLTAGKLAEEVIAKGVLIRDCSNFPGLSEQYFRIGVKDREKNLTLISALEEVLKGREIF